VQGQTELYLQLLSQILQSELNQIKRNATSLPSLLMLTFNNKVTYFVPAITAADGGHGLD
jgi:hypothetical protein